MLILPLLTLVLTSPQLHAVPFWPLWLLCGPETVELGVLTISTRVNSVVEHVAFVFLSLSQLVQNNNF